MGRAYIIPGKRIPFAKAGTNFSAHESIDLSIPVMQAMAQIARPDLVIWGQVIPSATISNIARDALLRAKLGPKIPAFSTVLACATSMIGGIQASGMVGRGGANLIMVGGVESMSNVTIALKPKISQKIAYWLSKEPSEAEKLFHSLKSEDFDLPVRGWANSISGRSMGEHTEDTAKLFEISREEQDKWAYESHKRVVAAQKNGFFDDLIIPFDGVDRDLIPRADSTLEKLANLPTVFDTSGKGSLTAGNSSPLTDGSAAMWVANEAGLKQVDSTYAAQLVDWEISAMDYREEGILMAPARALPRLLARHNLRFENIALYEIHEAFAAQVLANVKAFTDPQYRKEKAGVDTDLGEFPWERLNPNGGSLAIGHPFAATGARDLSQTAKELSEHPSGSYAIVSICADGGQGVVVLLKRP